MPPSRNAVLVAFALAASLPLAAQQRTAPDAPHWAFTPVARPAVPALQGDDTGPIDAFVRQRLAAAGLARSPRADRHTLIRRLWLSLLGLPPTPDEIAAFVADPGADAFDRLVDQALADPRYGERQARHWLDVVRFAESNGFETNRERPNAWRYRDWVIEAFNQDLPFDQFVRAQIAGDAFGVDVATGFLVAGPVDIVGSPDPVLTAQQRANEIDDMVATTGTAFLGLTVGCARCHDHKFDPIRQRDYYAMSAVFAGVKHGERALPPSPQQKARLAEVEQRIASLERLLAPHLLRVEPVTPTRPVVDFARNEELFAPVTATAVRFQVLATTGGEPCLDELEVWAGDRNVALAAHGATATASGTLPGYAIHQLAHVNDGEVGNEHSWISAETGGGFVEIRFAQPERIDRIVWGRDRTGRFRDRLAVAYRIDHRDGNGDGVWRLLASSADRQPFPGPVVAASRPVYRFDDLEPWAQQQAEEWLELLGESRGHRTALTAASMLAYAGTFQQPGPTHLLHRGDPLQQQAEVAPATLALFAPAGLPADAPEADRRRMLAEWITRGDHPLTARVLVNRVWQHHFGTGLVSTPNDFGRNGAPPSHPELLDWLASEFVAGGFSVKALHRAILRSWTWQQDSVPNADGLRVDAQARLLWRFPPQRLPAEAIRDSILAVSGELDPTRGGPGFSLFEVDRENVYHYHPKATFGRAESRRMVYATKIRMEQDAVFGAFDCPDGSLAVGRRSVSTTPLQALNLFHSGFVMQQSELGASRLVADVGNDLAARVDRLWQLAYGREPNAEERADALAFARCDGMAALWRVVINSNEFLFLP